MEFAERVRGLTESEIRKGITDGTNPDFISFAGGVPDAKLFPANEFRAAYDKVLRDAPGTFLQYGPTAGYGKLREFVAEREHTDVPRILLTCGAQQGLDLLGRLFIDEGSRVLVEDPTYLGALETFRQYGAEFVAVPSDDEGIRIDALRDAGPARFLYTMPNFANPSGRTMSERRRRELVAAAHDMNLVIVEDDAYGDLRYEGDPLPNLSTLDSNVIRIGSFSKVLAPGLRVGWVRAEPGIIRKLVHLKERSDLCGPLGAQMAIAEVSAILTTHVKTLVEAYRPRRDAMTDALAEFCPRVAWHRPEGGFFVWCGLPVDARGVSPRDVAFVPGERFHATRPRPNTLRLSFAGVEPDRIREGVRRIGEALS